MNTPICDFVRRYIDSGALRLHMPGHKGIGEIEKLDITEISGADSLYEAEGIIAESELNASKLFGCSTFYSTEGSSQCIRTMLYLAVLKAREQGRKPVILAGRNAHKTFLSASALIDFHVEWIYPRESESYLSCNITAEKLEECINGANEKPAAVYLTSPDYLGNVADISALSKVCKKYGIMLLVDNAHGAYLRFLTPSQHPMDLGADMCCDSAHKTLPVLTGGAYLHIADKSISENAKNALALFGSTSPSYLILQSLDKANVYLSDSYKEKLFAFCKKVQCLKKKLSQKGYSLVGDEPIKITVCAKSYGYLGYELADILRKNGIESEFADPDYLVFMLTPEYEGALDRIALIMESIPQKTPVKEKTEAFKAAKRVMSVRDAMFSPMETVSVDSCVGRILAAASVGCPPAVPIVVCGELIDVDAVKTFKYYGIEKCCVIK